MWCTIIATDGNCSIFFNNDSRVLLEKQHTQEPKYKRNSRKTKIRMRWKIRTKIANHENAPLVYLVVMTWRRQWFSWTCWWLAVLALRLSTIFFQIQQNKRIPNRSFVWRRRKLYKCPFGMDYFCQLILLFNLFLQLFISHTALFDTILKSYYTISVNFYLYLQYFQKKNFSFSKINGF